jgi:L-ascorbate metabolism protein UlaG (beta-lactamase superfamily)
MRKLGQLWRLVRESHADPLEGEPRLPLAVAEHEAAITFIGHSSFLLQLGDTTPLRITMTPAKHWGARMFNDTHRGFGGYLLEAPGSPHIYHSGDTAYFQGFAEIGRRLKPEIALLPIGAYFPDSYRAVHTCPEEALQAFLDLGADTMVPMHYNTFRLGREPMDEPLPRLMRAAEVAGVEDCVHPLAEGESWLVPASFTDSSCNPGLSDRDAAD